MIRLWFSLAPAMAVTTIKLTGSGTKPIALGKPTFGGDVKLPVEASIPGTLVPGTYKVSWTTASKDMHRISGDYTFIVR
jgi:methionine-rich copper-binding protein CopC